MTTTNNKYDKKTQDLFFKQIKSLSQNSITSYNPTKRSNMLEHNKGVNAKVGLATAPFDIDKRNKELLIMFQECGVDLIE